MKREWLLPVECGSWVPNAQLYRESDKNQMRWWQISVAAIVGLGQAQATSETQRCFNVFDDKGLWPGGTQEFHGPQQL